MGKLKRITFFANGIQAENFGGEDDILNVLLNSCRHIAEKLAATHDCGERACNARHMAGRIAEELDKLHKEHQRTTK